MIFGGISGKNSCKNYLVLNSNSLSVELGGELPKEQVALESNGTILQLEKNIAMFIGSAKGQETH